MSRPDHNRIIRRYTDFGRGNWRQQCAEKEYLAYLYEGIDNEPRQRPASNQLGCPLTAKESTGVGETQRAALSKHRPHRKERKRLQSSNRIAETSPIQPMAVINSRATGPKSERTKPQWHSPAGLSRRRHVHGLRSYRGCCSSDSIQQSSRAAAARDRTYTALLLHPCGIWIRDLANEVDRSQSRVYEHLQELRMEGRAELTKVLGRLIAHPRVPDSQVG